MGCQFWINEDRVKAYSDLIIIYKDIKTVVVKTGVLNIVFSTESILRNLCKLSALFQQHDIP